MKAAAEQEPHHRLKFHWPQRPQISLPLVGFLFLSVLAHGVAFYILQVVDPPAVAITPPPVQVTLLTATPENEALLRWIDAEDPAAIANPHEVVPGNLYDLSYQRSLTETRATPKSPDAKEAAVAFPPAQDTVDVIGSTQAASPNTTAEMPPLPTELKFSGQLAGRKINKQGPLKFDIPAAASRDRVRFMVGVGPDGKVLYTFFMGVEMDDQSKQAEDYLSGMEFARAPGEISWGIATYYWGNDTYQPGKTGTAQP